MKSFELVEALQIGSLPKIDATWDLTKEENAKSNANGKKILDELNKRRRDKLKFFVCYICGDVNQHLTKDCTKAICYICTGKHTTRSCPYLSSCQLCGSNQHQTRYCNSMQGIKFRLSKVTFCHYCRRPGHTAATCNIRNRKRRRYYSYSRNSNYFYKNKNKRYYSSNRNYRRRKY